MRVPAAAGVKITLMMQPAPAPRLDPQVLVCVKSLAFEPETEMLAMVRTALPVLVSVTDWDGVAVPTDGLPKVRLEGETLTPDAAPVPERLTACGLPVALSEMASDAARPPLEEGVKVTLMVQLVLAATLEPQLLVWAKSLAFEPVTEMPVMFRAALPVLVRVRA